MFAEYTEEVSNSNAKIGGVPMPEKAYIAIDLKSFYASVECVERGLDPLTTNLVVADESRTTKTICLAATPAIKSYGVPGRARLFEVVQKLMEAISLGLRNAAKTQLALREMWCMLDPFRWKKRRRLFLRIAIKF